MTKQQVSAICEAFSKLTYQHQSLEAHYFYLVDEADRLNTLKSDTQAELNSLRATASDIDQKSIQDLAGPLIKQGTGNTYNQLFSVMDEVQSNQTLQESAYAQERTGIVFFMFMKQATTRALQMMKLIERSIGWLPNIDLADLSEIIGDVALDQSSSAEEHSNKFPVHLLTKDPSLHLSDKSSELLSYHLRNQPILRLFLEESNLKLFCSRYGNNDVEFMLHFGELLVNTNTEFKATVEKLTRSFGKMLQDTCAEERRAAKEFGEVGRAINRRRSEVLLRVPCDASLLPFNFTEAQASINAERRSIFSPPKSSQSNSVQIESQFQKQQPRIVPKVASPSISPRRGHLKRPLFLFPGPSTESSDEEKELSLLRLERKTIKIRKRQRTEVPGSTRSEDSRRKMSQPGLSPMKKSQDKTRFEEIKKLRNVISKVRRQGKRNIERESEKSAREMIKSCSQPRLRNGKLPGPPDWNKNAYFPLLHYSLKQQVKHIINTSSLTSRYGL